VDEISGLLSRHHFGALLFENGEDRLGAHAADSTDFRRPLETRRRRDRTRRRLAA
jgi:hypothetical protein